MKARSPLWTIAIALTGVLLISVGMIALGTHETESFPSAHSYLPSGTAALEELFRKSGYQVVVDNTAAPVLNKGDLAIAFYPMADPSVPTPTGSGDTSADPLQPTRDDLTKFVQEGGSLLSLPVNQNFAGDSKAFLDKAVTVHSASGKQAKVNWDTTPVNVTFIPDSDQHFPLWAADPTARNATDFVSLHRVGKGSDAVLANGIIASNRFLDKNENALVLMETARVLAKPGARVVFVEAAFGNVEDPSLTELIGPWAKAAWLQLVFLGIVAIYTLGKPFGLPDPERREQKGSRELLDAMADTLRRGRMTRLALRSVYEDTNRLLRKWFRTPRNTDRADLEAYTMIDLHNSLNRVQAAMEIGAPEDEAAKMVRDVERLVKEVATSGSHPYRIGS